MEKPKYADKTCKHHGVTQFVLEGRGYYRCLRCRRARVAHRRRKAKALLVEAHGGKCRLCGYDRYVGSLDFHHVDRKTKSFGIASDGQTRSYARMVIEANKCVLLCRNCHSEVEGGVTKLPPDCLPIRVLVPNKVQRPVRVIDPNWRHRPRPERRKVERPPIETLQTEVAALGYSATGRKYGVSDNAVRKWLRSS